MTHVPDIILNHDTMMREKYGIVVSQNGRVERRIVANLIAHLDAQGFSLHSIYDGETTTRVDNTKAAMELIFDLDEASLRFFSTRLTPDDWHGVLLVLGNGVDIISDWNYYTDDRDGFNAAMDSFDTESA